MISKRNQQVLVTSTLNIDEFTLKIFNLPEVTAVIVDLGFYGLRYTPMHCGRKKVYQNKRKAVSELIGLLSLISDKSQ